MARTPLFRAVRRALRRAALDAPPEELAAIARASRRRFLKSGAAAALAATSGGALSSCVRSESPALGPIDADARIAVVGAGLAGLAAAHALRKGGLRPMVYEAATRSGGRIFTGTDVVVDGFTTELGAEFIDSNHADVFALIREFELETIDTASEAEAALTKESYFFGERARTEAEVIELFRGPAARIAADAEGLSPDFDFRNPGNAARLDRMSLEAYLEQIEVRGWVRDLLEVAYVTEFGLEAGEQSALNLITLISPDVSEGRFDVFGESDERFKIRGGNQRLTDALTRSLEGQIVPDRRLESLRERGGAFELGFRSNAGVSYGVRADLVLLAIPFSLLRRVAIDVDLPSWKRKAIDELGYGQNAKVFLGFNSRPWRAAGASGNFFTDLAAQSGWDHTRGQAGEAGAMTVFLGGGLGIASGRGRLVDLGARFILDVDRILPGLREANNGRVQRFHWPTAPLALGSYSCYTPGQWTSIGGAEFEPVGNLYFAGEHCSGDFQGFMNGAAETGRRAAEAILARAASGVAG
jgi:monoamine oxidase